MLAYAHTCEIFTVAIKSHYACNYLLVNPAFGLNNHLIHFTIFLKNVHKLSNIEVWTNADIESVLIY